MSARLCFVDTETTGLDPTQHEIWELAWQVREADGTEPPPVVHQLYVDVAKASPDALRIGRFYERYDLEGEPATWTIAEEFARASAGAHLVAAVPSFDAGFLAPWLRANRAAPAWHYHLIDVEALAAGMTAIAPPWNSDELSRTLGVNSLDFERHTALGDVQWARAIYDAVLGEKRWKEAAR